MARALTMICENPVQYIAQYPNIHRRFEFRTKALLVMYLLKSQVDFPFFPLRIKGIALLQGIVALDLVQDVLSLTTDAQIVPLVVERVMVNVIDDFGTGQGPAQHTLTNEAVQQPVGPCLALGAEDYMSPGQDTTSREALTNIGVTVIDERDNPFFLIDEQFLHAHIIPEYNTMR